MDKLIREDFQIMKSIYDIDPNFNMECDIPKSTKYYNVKDKPIKIYGLYKPCEVTPFMRMDENVAKEVNEGVYNLNYNTSGGRVRFKTNSDYVALYVKVKSIHAMHHMTLVGNSCFDLYEKTETEYRYGGSFVPSGACGDPIGEVAKNGFFVSKITLPDKKMRDLTINFPLYNGAEEVMVGISDDAQIVEADSYTYEKPVLYYGSSITQGGCANRPGMSYANIVSRHFDIDFLNLGFSGSGKGEIPMAEYIANQDASIFVCDYDHNAPTPEYLLETHERLFKIFREKHAEVPVIFMSRPKKYLTEEEVKRKEIIYKTYENAKNSGDSNVYFIDGSEMFNFPGGDECTVDGCHPTDLGFRIMADNVIKVMENILK